MSPRRPGVRSPVLLVLSPGGSWEAVPYSGPEDLASGGATYARKAMVREGRSGLCVVFVSWDGGSVSTECFIARPGGLWVPGVKPKGLGYFWVPLDGAVPVPPEEVAFGDPLAGVPAADLLRRASAPGFAAALSVMES